MATNTIQITGAPTFSPSYAAELAEHVRRYVAGTNGAYATAIAAASVPVPIDAPDTVAGTNGVLSSVITWVKSTDSNVVTQLVELIANSNGAVLAAGYVAPATQTLTLSTTAVNQKARVTAINSTGSTASDLSATILPTAS